ncbi:thiamine pyrophosphate-dependent acetolactate synthase large subunit-like protein [Actinokineospora baliensis]|uniref:thiamine pyrophosphate-binding protein n=1 Tax=Actinokineospora baliensis TaxID=547056 RepID=UPI00195E4626|nr:thiamine pyrophosphate-binding protein [Actinokineospora baliensis]MBM7774539.1 thiamine pyrophosphate-dependent acetolactate synthase large subunit-like protein [Actinokineospora baliensis]
MSTLAAAVAATLAEHGIRHAFGVVGGGNIMTVAGLTAAGVHYVAARHEGGAVAMADAYHRATGEVAVCTTSHGPGVTNIATGLAEAVKHRSGLLVVCGDAPTDRMRRIDVDQTMLARSLGAEVVRLDTPETARADTARALRIARERHCPVVLCLPGDLLTAEIPDVVQTDLDQRVPVAPAELVGLDAALRALAGARRPLLLAGLGAWRSGAAKPIADLGDRVGALLATTAMATGLFDGTDWSVGICGGFSSPAAADLIRQADVVVAFGASLDLFTLHGGRLISPHATVIQVDPAGSTADRVDLPVTGDASTAASALLDGLDNLGAPASTWRDEVGDLSRVGWAHHEFEDRGSTERIDPRTLTRALADLLPEDRTLVLDGGHFITWPMMYWPVTDPSALVFIGSAFQVIGLGFAGAVGAACGRADRTTVVALGDGGALMGISELETLIRTAHSAIVVVYDDAAYGFEAHLYGPKGADLTTAVFDQTDFAGVARALGAQAETVRTVADLAALRTWLDDGAVGTIVLDCKVNPDVIAGFLTDMTSGH